MKLIKYEQWSLLTRYLFCILPQVEKELQGWKKFLRECSSSPLQQQALYSIRDKRFHCQGGAFFALFNPAACSHLLSLIVSFQTISDYLDNLCDRVTWEDSFSLKEKDLFMEKSFRHLHTSMLVALDTVSPQKHEFYRYYPYNQDKGYLQSLVMQCQKNIAALPVFDKVKEKVLFLTRLYCDLQSLKHLSFNYRQKHLEKWFKDYEILYPYLLWHEFAAAAGSTLGIFVLSALASKQSCSPSEIEKIFKCYFPWICGLHILLDYYIDQEEDRREGDLNFIFFYSSPEQCFQRLKFFIENALQRAGELDNPTFHRLVVKGLLALYLSDPKVVRQNLGGTAPKILAVTGEKDIFYLYRACQLLRKTGII